MNPYAKYQEQSSPCWTRIDMLLALYDGAVERCEQALVALEQPTPDAARTLIRKARLIVMGLVSGIVPDGDPVTTNILRLLEYVLHALDREGIEDLRGALNVLHTLRDGFQQVRAEAVALERGGAIAPVDAASTVRALA